MGKGKLIAEQQLTASFNFNIYTKAEADAKFATKEDTYTKAEVDFLVDEKADVSNVYTKTETDTLLEEKADKSTTYTKTETNTLLSAKADKSTTLAGYGITDAYTKTQTDNLLNGKADTDSVYTKEETDNLLSIKANSADVYTKTETNNLLSVKADSANVYTKTEADTLLAGKADTDDVYTKAQTDTLLSVKANSADVYTKTESNTLLAGKANVDDVYTKTEIDNQLTVTKDGTWVKGTQTTAINLEKLEGGIEYLYGLLSYKYSQLRKYINGNYYDYETNTDSAYTKTVPAGAMPYAGLEQIGGKTLVWNQLSQIPQNATYTYTIANNTYQEIANIPLTSGHQILFNIDYVSDTEGCGLYGVSNGTRHQSKYAIFTQGSTYTFRLRIYNFSGAEATVTISNINVIVTDLTICYGAGNEPTTIEQFREMFPAEYYSYNAGTLLSAGVTEVVSKDGNNATLQTIPIPASIQALEGYGWSAGTAYNYIDFERKVFVQNVARVDLGTLTWTWNSARGAFSNSTLKSVAKYSTSIQDENINFVSEKYLATTVSSIRLLLDNQFVFGTSGAFWVKTNGTQNIAPTGMLYYALATPIETDISAYLSVDNLIEVEAGGTLTFPNSNGDNYRIPVPSTEEYMINLQEAVSNG